MEPFFVACMGCHRGRTWHHRDENMDCPEGCGENMQKPWWNGFGPDRKPVARHKSTLYGDGDEWPDYVDIPPYIANETEMKELLR